MTVRIQPPPLQDRMDSARWNQWFTQIQSVIEALDAQDVSLSADEIVTGNWTFDNVITFAEGSSPGTPSSGYGYLWPDSSNSHLKWTDDSGTTYDITAGGVSTPIAASADSASAPAYSWSGDSDTGMYRVGADTIGFAANGSSRVEIGTFYTSFENPIRLTTGLPGTSPGSGNGYLFLDGSHIFWCEDDKNVEKIVGSQNIRKSAIEQVTNSSTLQDDDHLFFEVSAGVTYQYEIQVYIGATSTTPDFKWTVNTNSGTATVSEDVCHWRAYDSTLGKQEISYTTATTANTVQLPSLDITVLNIKGTIEADEDTTMYFKWAQNTTNAAYITVYENSYLIARELDA